jgi:hypothetical protein
MRRVYGRGDHFGNVRGNTFNMDVWLSRSGRLLARFWARSEEVDWLSFEITGYTQADKARGWDAAAKRDVGKCHELDEDWVPECLRDEYDDWVISEL